MIHWPPCSLPYHSLSQIRLSRPTTKLLVVSATVVRGHSFFVYTYFHQSTVRTNNSHIDCFYYSLYVFSHSFSHTCLYIFYLMLSFRLLWATHYGWLMGGSVQRNSPGGGDEEIRIGLAGRMVVGCCGPINYCPLEFSEQPPIGRR